jgi:hypothetical protein
MGWSPDILSQLDDGHRLMFPAVLTHKSASDRKVTTFLRGRTLGNSSTQLQHALNEQHSEAWMRRCIHYLSDCQQYSRKVQEGVLRYVAGREEFDPPPPLRRMLGARWLVTCYANESLSRLEQVKASITSIYGRVLKMDSTKKVRKD